MPTPTRPSISQIQRDIVTCEVALVTLAAGGEVFELERRSLRHKLSDLLGVRHLDREGGTILCFPSREAVTPAAWPDRGLT
jgi:hypothetical protein